MTVYRYFLKLAYRNKKSIIIYSLIYFFLMILTGINMDSNDKNYKDIGISIGYMDNSETDISRGLIKSLENKNYIEPIDFNYDEIKEELYLERYEAIIVIPKDFKERVLAKEENIIEVFKDPKSMYTVNLENEIGKYLSFFNAMNSNGNYDMDQLERVLKTETDVSIVGDSQIKSRIEYWFTNYFNYLSYILILVFITIFGRLMQELGDDELMKRVSLSSMSNFKYNKELYLGQLTVAGVLTTIYIFAAIIFKFKFIGELAIGKYVINTIFFAFSILGLSFLINNSVRSNFMIAGIGTLLSLGVSFISGVFVSQDMLSEGTLRLARFFPSYYYIRANNMTINSIMDIKKELLILALFGIFYFLLGIYFSKNRDKIKRI